MVIKYLSFLVLFIFSKYVNISHKYLVIIITIINC